MALVDAAAYRSTKRTLIHGNRQFSHKKYDYPGRSPNARVRDWLNKLAEAGATRVLGKST
jgi:hypothetical protein